MEEPTLDFPDCKWIWEFAAAGDLPGVEGKVAEGVCIDATDDDGRTALMAAVCNGADDIAAWLLDSGASIEARDNEGNTALMLAARRFRTSSVQLLLDYGADVDVVDTVEQCTALDFASKALQAREEWHAAAYPDPDADTGHDGVTLAKMRACAQTLANPARFMQWRRRAPLTTWKHACGSGSEICK
ncbi:hypothetical protein FNF28_04824 [Cafeteria roenbergensis]|uniref:Ankyrin repeat domain-containing protein n=1 Tax=Cafeteria roenbergensis TaxID=33653 RepID=A0A5A8DD31_CAFRO|nr:hypothetical protein FNF28_04824 [Cafeteria roenbergensis]